MARHQGALIVVDDLSERDREGVQRPIDRIVAGDGTLYYARQLADHPRIASFERWLIPAQGWVVNRFHLYPEAAPLEIDWYVDIDHVEHDGARWRVDDRFLDLVVREGVCYELWDADELADGIEAREISEHETVAALRSLHALTVALHRLQFSVQALLAEYAPGLPG